MTKANGPLFAIHYRRRREGKTDYSKRLALLKSRKPRLVIRKTNRNLVAQVVEFTQIGDKVIAYATSRELNEHGTGNKCNTPSAYLTGLAVGKRAKEKKITEVVVDLGRQTASKGSLLFAVVKGAIDAGLKTDVAADKLPKQERMQGKHLNEKVQTSFDKAKKKLAA